MAKIKVPNMTSAKDFFQQEINIDDIVAVIHPEFSYLTEAIVTGFGPVKVKIRYTHMAESKICSSSGVSNRAPWNLIKKPLPTERA